MSQGCYVNRVSKGQKYWFVSVSIPRDVLNIELTYEEFARQPGQLHKIVARKLDEALLGAGRAEPRSGVPFPGENPFDSVRREDE